MHEKLLIIGISGVTCGGKTTAANELNKILPNSKIISQDDYFLDVEDPRHLWIPEINHINFDVLSSLDMEKMHTDILEYIRDKPLACKIKKEAFQESNGLQYQDIRTALYRKINDLKMDVLLIEGFSVFNYKPLLNLFHLKYYFTLNRDECHRRRLKRVYEPPDCPGYFEKCVWPEHLLQLEEVQNSVENVSYINEFCTSPLDVIVNDVYNYLTRL